MNTRASKSFAIWASVLAVIVALVALTVAGCGSSKGTLALTEADNGRSFTAKVGDTISVVLAGNPTTGYLWEAALADDATTLLTLVGEPAYAPDKVATGVVGSGGMYTFTFSAAAAGQVELKLKYWRPFEAEANPLQTFSANITIE
jgi:inhibitor of cysteine peptidase